MANDGKIYIIITDKPGGEGSSGLEDTPASDSKSVSEAKAFAAHHFRNFIISQTKQFISYNVQNIGNFTGDYVTQRKVSEAMQAATILGNIGMATLAGAKMGGPWGAVAGAAIAIAGTAINAGYEHHTQVVQNAKINYNIDQLRRRSGLNSYTDGSRGTEN